MIEFLTGMPTHTKILLTVAVLGLAAVLTARVMLVGQGGLAVSISVVLFGDGVS
jgi:hypothetical protein